MTIYYRYIIIIYRYSGPVVFCIVNNTQWFLNRSAYYNNIISTKDVIKTKFIYTRNIYIYKGRAYFLSKEDVYAGIYIFKNLNRYCKINAIYTYIQYIYNILARYIIIYIINIIQYYTSYI